MCQLSLKISPDTLSHAKTITIRIHNECNELGQFSRIYDVQWILQI